MLKKKYFFSAFYPLCLLLAPSFSKDNNLQLEEEKTAIFQWCQFFLLSELLFVEKSEHNNFQYRRRKTPIFLRLLCFSSFSMNLSHVPRSKRRKNQRVEVIFSSSFSPGGLFKFFVVVEEEGLFFLASLLIAYLLVEHS